MNNSGRETEGVQVNSGERSSKECMNVRCFWYEREIPPSLTIRFM